MLLMALAFGCVVQDVNHDGVKNIIVMADSNSQASWDASITRWPERVKASFDQLDAYLNSFNPSFHLNWNFYNLAWFGMTACDLGRSYGSFQLGAPQHIQETLDNFAPDLIIFAYGTNDIYLGVTPAQLLQCYQDLRATALARGVHSMVALTPHVLSPPILVDRNAAIDEANALLVANLPYSDIIDFVKGMLPEDYMSDGLHLADPGQIKRMQAAYIALLRP